MRKPLIELEAFNKFAELLFALETKFKDMCPLCPVWTEPDEEGKQIGFGKHDGKWRILYRIDNREELPFADCPLVVRIGCAKYIALIPDLISVSHVEIQRDFEAATAMLERMLKE